MKRIVLSTVLALATIALFAQTTVKKPVQQGSGPAASTAGYNIAFTLTPYKNTKLYLGTYFGKNFILVDSSMVSAQSTGVFKGKTKLTQGIYFFVSPARTKLFDILVDGPQHYTIVADSTSEQATSITGSPENTLFLNYTQYLSGIGPKMSQLDVQLKDPNITQEKSGEIKKQLADYNKQLNTYRENIITTKPNSILATIFNLMKSPDVPAKLPVVNGKNDSSYIGRYMKEHYWDGVAFNDDRILHTPIFDPKLDNYIKYYVSPHPDSIFAEINYMLLYARSSKEMFHYLLGRFTDKYINPEIMGQNKVFTSLYENYYAKGDTLWLNAAQRKYVTEEYYKQISNLIGNPAAALEMTDTAGKAVKLHDVKAPFTFVVFWDPTCSHCKEEIPQVDSLYEAKWKAEGVKIFAVNVNDATLDEWKVFIKEHHLEGWVHAYQTRAAHDADTKAQRPNFRQLYNVFQTPTMYLLDANKNIVANKLSLTQFDGIIDAKIKNPTASK